MTELAPVAMMIRAERSQIERILVNLLSSAGDALPGGGRITVRTLHLPMGHPSHPPAGPVGEPAVLLSVDDTGVGMSAEVLARVFDPYFSTKPGGTGLGLSIVAQLVRECGGWIGVSSVPGRGSRFDLVLPVLPEVNR